MSLQCNVRFTSDTYPVFRSASASHFAVYRKAHLIERTSHWPALLSIDVSPSTSVLEDVCNEKYLLHILRIYVFTVVSVMSNSVH